MNNEYKKLFAPHYKCPICGNVEHEYLHQGFEINKQEREYLQGWVCPKCGAVISPYKNICPNCTPPQELKIWC